MSSVQWAEQLSQNKMIGLLLQPLRVQNHVCPPGRRHNASLTKMTVGLQTCEKPATADHTLAIEEETIRMWRAEDNREAIIADERQEQPQLAINQPSQLPVQELPPRIDTPGDFGETPFVLTFETLKLMIPSMTPHHHLTSSRLSLSPNPFARGW
jgi:hypothetical protein